MFATEVLSTERSRFAAVMRMSCLVVSIADGASEGPRLVYPMNAMLGL